ncbi:MAG: hypothetical protein ISS36_04125 [Candidatus Aenigmarchaeota archaeon]|nr:hypothetical protein [Candidatus Aenigmarchaeota archaeon]
MIDRSIIIARGQDDVKMTANRYGKFGERVEYKGPRIPACNVPLVGQDTIEVPVMFVKDMKNYGDIDGN